MPKRKKSTAPKKAKKNATKPKCDKVPSPAKKMVAVSSTSQLEEAQVSSCTSLPVDLEIELESEAPLSPSGLSCTCCNFSTSTKMLLDDHMQQHKLNCPWCPFNSLTYLEVIHHCKFKHDKSAEIDTIPCHACVYCSFMTYIPEHLEKHTALKHPYEPFKFIPKIISKQVSASVRIDDAMFCQTLSNNNTRPSFMKIEAGSHSGGKSNPIIIDAAQEVSKDIKHEANSGSLSETCPSIDEISKEVLINYLLTDFAASNELKAESGTFETKCEVRAVEASHLEVKLERLYCLTCPYSSISSDELKCHTVGQHPVGAAAATYNASGESASMDDMTFFCVKQSCTFSSFDYSSYQRHLVDCCAFQKALSVLERARLKTTIMHILDCQRKYVIKLEDVFLNFALSCLCNQSEGNQAVGTTSSNLRSQTSLPPMNENVSQSSLASSNHSSLPETTFLQIAADNQQTSSAGMSLSYTQQGNIETFSNYLGSTQQSQSNNQGVSNVCTRGHILEDVVDQRVNILNTFSLSTVSSQDPNISNSIPSNAPLNTMNIPSNVPSYTASIPSNVLVNLNNLPSNVPIISMNALSNIPVNSSSESSIVPTNGHLLQLHQFPVNNISNFHLDQTGNKNQQQASFSAGPVNHDATVNAHSFLGGTNSASLEHQQQPGVLINSGQSRITNWHQQNSLASNSAIHTNASIMTGPDNKSFIGPSNSFTVQAHSANQAAAEVSHFKIGSPQQSSAWLVEGEVFSNVVTAQNQCVPGNLNYASTAGRPNNVAGMSQIKAGSIYQNVTVSQPNMTADRMANGQQCGIFTTAANVNRLTSNGKHIIPSSQLNTNRDTTVFGQESGNLMTADNSQCGLYHNSSQYNTIAGRTSDLQTQQSGIFTSTGLKQSPPGNLAYTTPANRPVTSLNYGSQSGNLMAASLNHSITGNQNQMSSLIDPMISQETCQTQHSVNQTGPGISTQQDSSDSNTILVFDISASKSKLHELTYGNQKQLPPGTFYQPTNLNAQNQAMVRPVKFAESVGQSGIDSQTVTPRLESTMRCSSAENNSRRQVSCPSVSQSGYFTSESESVSSYFGSQTVDGAGNNKTICSSLPGQLSSAQVMLSVSHTSCIPSFERGSALPAPLNQRAHALRSVSMHTGLRMTVSPQRANPAGPVIISSPAPRIHHQQNPAVGRTFMGRRGAALSGASPRSSPTLAAPQRHQRGVMRQKPVGRGRGQARSLRMLPGSGRASHNAVCCDDDDEDDDVIMTSGFSPGDSQNQNRPSGCRLPVAQPQWTPSMSSHHDSQISKVHVAVARSNQTPRSQQSKKHVDVGGHFENLVCALNASTNADIIDVAPEDDVEILSVVAEETSSGPTQSMGLEVFQKTRTVENPTLARGQKNSVTWNLKDNFSNGLSNVYSDILNSSLRLPHKPSVRHAVPPTQANISGNQQSLVRLPAYSEQNDVARQGSTPHNPSPNGTPIRASLRQISPAGLSSSHGHKQMQQRAPHPAQLQKITTSKALTSSITSSSKSPPHSQKHSSVINVDTECPIPSRQPNKNISINKESHQVIFVDPEQKSMDKESAQDVIILDADPSEHLRQTETDISKTAKPPGYFIILDGDSSENLMDKETNMSTVNEHANRKLTTPAFSVPSTRGNKTMRPQSVGHNVGNKRIYTPRGQLTQPFTPAHQGASSNSRVRPQLRQHAFIGSNSLSPATRHAVRAPRAASVSPVSVRHPNHFPNSTVTQRGPQPQPQPTSRGSYFQNKNGPQTVINKGVASELSNLAVSNNGPVNLGVSFVTSGCSKKAGVSEMKVETTQRTVLPSPTEKSQLDSKGSHTSVEDRTAVLNSQINQSKVPKNLPALLLAKFKKCVNLKQMSSVAQQAVVNETTAGNCNQRTSLGSDAKGANQNPEVLSSQSSECSNKAGKGVCTAPPFQPLPKLPASLSSISEGRAVQEVADLNESNTSLLSAMDSDKIIIYDLDVNEKQLMLSSSVDTILSSAVNKQQQDSIPAVQNQLVGQQNVTLNTSSDQKLISSQFSTVRNTRLAAKSRQNFNLANSIPDAGKPIPTDINNCQSGQRQTVEITKHDSHLYNQVKDFSGAHDPLKDPPVLRNHLKDSPAVPSQLTDPPVLHNELKASPVFHSKLQDSPVFHSQLQDSPGLHNQLRHSPNVTNQQEDSCSVPGATFLPSEAKPQDVRPQFQFTNKAEPSTGSNLQELPAGNQTIPSAGPAEIISQVFTKGRRKSRKGTKRHETEPGELLDKTKKQMTKETVVNESENKESVIETNVIRHSDRLLKTVVKDLKISGCETDGQLSDDSEFCSEEEDLDGDTDSEWSDGQGKNNKTKSKGADTSQDPTAFDTMIKGKFKCWLCRKVYSRCAFAKDHIMKKHFAGLCVLDLQCSKETRSVCLLMFCPRKCTYASNTLDGINSHTKTCKKLALIHEGYNFIEINQVFIDQKYTELLNLPFEIAMCPALIRKPKDLTKPPKRKKPKSSLSNETVNRTPCGAPHTIPNAPEASSVPVASLRHTVANRRFVSSASQNASAFQAHNLQAQQLNQGQGLTGHSAAVRGRVSHTAVRGQVSHTAVRGQVSHTAVRGQVSHQQRSNSFVGNISQMSMQFPVTSTPRAAFSKGVPSSINFKNAHQRSPPLLQSPGQQLITSNSAAPSNISPIHHLSESCSMDQSTEHEDIYVVEDSDIICLE